MNKLKSFLFAVLVALGSTSLANEPITLVVPLAPGGATDIIARYIAKKMTDNGTPTIVLNRPGADRIIGSNFVAESAPDGKTLFVGSSSDVVLLPLLKNPALKFNENTFIPVAPLGATSPVLTANPKVPFNNFKEFLAAIKKDPEKYPIGSFGKLTDLQAYSIFKMAGVRPVIVSYRSDPLLATDLIGGSLALGIQTIPAQKENINAGRIKPIAMLGTQRDKNFPAIGTIAEVNGWNSRFWYGIFAPPGTPDSLVKKLNMEISQLMSTPDSLEWLDQRGFERFSANQSQFTEHYRQQINFYRPIAEEFQRVMGDK